MPDITVIGAGVIGLTTALALSRAGHRVRIVAAATRARTTSWVAGAVWYPYRVGPPDRAARWAGRTADWLIDVASRDRSAGVDLLTRYERVDSENPPWWIGAARDARLVREGFHGAGGGAIAWAFTAPRCEPSIFLPWLESQLPEVEIRSVESLADVAGDLVVNCTGLGGRRLTGDTELQGIFGQVVMVEPGKADMTRCPGDERDADAIFYAIPRRREIVLGGCAIACDDDAPTLPVDEVTAAVLQRASEHGVVHGPVLRAAAGIRPFRPAVRLERQGRVIHNYGHGGAGYTLGWGCACEVVDLVGQSTG